MKIHVDLSKDSNRIKISKSRRGKKKKKSNLMTNIFYSFFLTAFVLGQFENIDVDLKNNLTIVLLVIFTIGFMVLNRFISKFKGYKINKRKVALDLIMIVVYATVTNNINGYSLEVIIAYTIILVVYLLHRIGVFTILKRKILFKNITLDKIDNMSGSQFEEYLEMVFKKRGFKVYRTQLSGDFGADLVIEKKGIKSVVQAKRYSKNVGLSAVQEVVSAKLYYNSTKAIVVTNIFYTKSAIKLAEVNGVSLYDRVWLEKNLVKL